MFETPHDFDDRTEIAIYDLTRLMLKSMGAQQVGDMLLSYIIASEAHMASKFDIDHPSLRLLNKYKEDVRMGKRKPLERK